MLARVRPDERRTIDMANSLEDLLAFPDDFLEETERWERLTECDRLFRVLCRAVWEPPPSWEHLRALFAGWIGIYTILPILHDVELVAKQLDSSPEKRQPWDRLAGALRALTERWNKDDAKLRLVACADFAAKQAAAATDETEVERSEIEQIARKLRVLLSRRERVDTILRMVRCAELAADRADSARGDIPRACASLHGGAQPVTSEEDRGWIRSLLTGLSPETHERYVTLPVALWDKKQHAGLVTKLRLEIVEGSGEVYLHPCDALATRIEKPLESDRTDDLSEPPADMPAMPPARDFMQSMGDAWAAACMRASSEGVDVGGTAGRFRVLEDTEAEKPLPEISGPSAAGAAALGWYLALRSMVPDDGVIVMADVRHSGTGYKPFGVGGIEKKVEAVAAAARAAHSAGRFDTIVVGSVKNRHEAEAVLGKIENDRIRVLLADEL
jgi:hypothetical protein